MSKSKESVKSAKLYKNDIDRAKKMRKKIPIGKRVAIETIADVFSRALDLLEQECCPSRKPT